MAPTLAERLAELIGLPIEVAKAYGRPQERVSAAQKIVGTVSQVEPAYRYATLKAVPGGIAPAEEAAPPKPLKNVENDLYAQWHDASDAEKPKLEKKLFNSVLRRAKNLIWKKIPEADENLARDIASVVIEKLPEFKGQSKFTTWEHRILLNQRNLYLREKVEDRDKYYVSENPEDDINLNDPKAEAAFNRVEQRVDLESLVKELEGKDYVLLQCRLEGMTIAEAAQKLGDSEDAAESRWRRLETDLKKKIRGNDDGK